MSIVPLTQNEPAIPTRVEDKVIPFSMTALGIIGLLFLGIYAPTFLWMMQRWQIDPSATHGWLVIPIAGAVAYGRRERLRTIPLSSHPSGIWVMGAALLFHLMEKFFDINGPSPLSIPIFIAGAVWYLAGTGWLKELAFPIAYLLFMVPIPGAVNQFVSFPLRLVAHNGSKVIAGWLGIPIVGAGMSMEFWRPGSDHTNPERDLVSLIIADPCSGLHSLMAIKALHAITAYMSRLTLGWKWVLFWCALPISLAANVCRMVLIILVSSYVDKNFGLHLFHDYSPYLLFLFVFGILFFVGLVMELVTGAYSREDGNRGGLANVG